LRRRVVRLRRYSPLPSYHRLVNPLHFLPHSTGERLALRRWRVFGQCLPQRLESLEILRRAALDETWSFDSPIVIEQLRLVVCQQAGQVMEVICLQRAPICIAERAEAQQAGAENAGDFDPFTQARVLPIYE